VRANEEIVAMVFHRTATGGRVAAISVSVPSVRFSSARRREMLPAVRAAAAAIDAELGNAPRQRRQVAN
jgi:DNA-binding IclR family transcriptional regulator